MIFRIKYMNQSLFFLPGPKLIALMMSCAWLSFSCRSQLQASQQEQEKAVPLLYFQKTACLGSCPAYDAAIATDGSVTFVGFAHTPSPDSLFFKISEDKLDSLKTAIANLNYRNLLDLYPTQWSDMPSTLTTFYENGKEVKRVKHSEGGPEELRQFQESLHNTLLTMAEKEAKKKLPLK